MATNVMVKMDKIGLFTILDFEKQKFLDFEKRNFQISKNKNF